MFGGIMNTNTLELTPFKIFTAAINMSAALILVLIVSGTIKSPPITAQELIAQGTVTSPILQDNFIESANEILSTEGQEKEFNQSVRQRYRTGYIYDITPGVKHIKLTYNCHGRPVRINVVEINQRINPNIKIAPQLSSTKLSSKSTITTIAKKQNSIAAINGTYFKPQTGVPLGTLMINKKMYTGPIYNRVALGIFEDGFDMARIELNANINYFGGSIQVDNINQPRMLSTDVIVYTPEWGNFSPATPKLGIQILVANGKIESISTQSLPIPNDGYVIIGPESKLKSLFKIKHANLDIKTIPNWDNVNHIISGGPYLVKNGRMFVDINEQKLGAISGKNPRTAVGYTKEGNFIMVAVDGREGASVGMTLWELASFMQSIGCINAMNLDGGGSTVMYVKDHVVNMPKVKGGIAISNALTISIKS
jgi:exopolysaccharide biosynthesis protein